MLPRPPFTAKQKKIFLVTVATGVPCFSAIDGQRGKMVRSYLLSAPRLLVTMWAGELSRRTRSSGVNGRGARSGPGS